MADANLMLHCGGRAATLAEVAEVPVPPRERIYCPVPHVDLVDVLRTRVDKVYPGAPVEESFGLDKSGSKLFGVMRVDTGEADDKGLAIGFRNSYDKSMSVGVALGLRVFVCDNLALSGSGITVLRKHTTNVWRDVLALVTGAIAFARQSFEETNAQLDAMKAVPLPEDRGYEVLGLALGQGAIGWRQASVAYEDWRTPRHEAFAERNLYSLYNAATEGLKKTSVASAMADHAGWHAFVGQQFKDRLAQARRLN